MKNRIKLISIAAGIFILFSASAVLAEDFSIGSYRFQRYKML